MNEYADIIPFCSLGGIELSTNIKDIKTLLEKSQEPIKVFCKFYLSYNIDNSIEININILTGKIYKLVALGNYKGKLYGKICIGMHITKVLELEPSFIYDDFEEVYESDKGIIIETDPVTENVLWISIYPKGYDLGNLETTNFI